MRYQDFETRLKTINDKHGVFVKLGVAQSLFRAGYAFYLSYKKDIKLLNSKLGRAFDEGEDSSEEIFDKKNGVACRINSKLLMAVEIYKDGLYSVWPELPNEFCRDDIYVSALCCYAYFSTEMTRYVHFIDSGDVPKIREKAMRVVFKAQSFLQSEQKSESLKNLTSEKLRDLEECCLYVEFFARLENLKCDGGYLESFKTKLNSTILSPDAIAKSPAWADHMKKKWDRLLNML